jgi:hypothetical protein
MDIHDFVAKMIEFRHQWIGGTLIDSGDAIDSQLFDSENNPAATPITDVRIDPHHSDCFQIAGEDFNCTANMDYLHVREGELADDKIVFTGYMGHTFQIIKPKADVEAGVDNGCPQGPCPPESEGQSEGYCVAPEGCEADKEG